ISDGDIPQLGATVLRFDPAMRVPEHPNVRPMPIHQAAEIGVKGWRIGVDDSGAQWMRPMMAHHDRRSSVSAKMRPSEFEIEPAYMILMNGERVFGHNQTHWSRVR